jgi:copper chaperone
VIEFKLPDMSCGHCAATVSQALKRLDPGCRIAIDLATRTIKVESREDRQALVQALGEAGYPPA